MPTGRDNLHSRSALLTDRETLEIVEGPVPTPGPREVLVSVLACGICATDLRKFRTLDDYNLTLPINLGHEYLGRVVSVGTEVTHVALDSRIVGDGYAGYADHALIPLDLDPPIHLPDALVVPDEVDDSSATFIEPLADCLHGLYYQASLKPGERVLVVGAGVMGQLLAQCARVSGSKVVIAEPNPDRSRLAEYQGFEVMHSDLTEEGHDSTAIPEGGFDLVVCSVGTETAISGALRSARSGGRILAFGGFPKGTKQTIDLNEIHYRELTIVGTHWVGVAQARPTVSCYPAAIRLLQRELVDVRYLITSTVELSEIREGFSLASQPASLKIIVQPRAGGVR
jgi:L-iditol 2-dehydrogenase